MNSPADLVEPISVDSSIYTDPSVFAAELDVIFRRCWICVGHVGELQSVGEYKTARLGSQSVVVVRHSESDIGVFYNRCRHRGTLLCDRPLGHLDKIICPYHGWTYSLAGALVGVPFSTGYDRATFNRGDYSLSPVARVELYRGFIFVNASADGESLESYLGNAREYIDAFVGEDGIDANSGGNTYEYAGNWKLQAENVLDDYHLPFVHESYFDVLNERAGSPVQPAPTNPRLRAWDLGNGHGLLDFREYDDSGELVDAGKRKNVSGTLPYNLLVFPTLALAADHIRLTTPLAFDRTRVQLIHVVPTGSSDEERQLRIKRHEDFYGPAGFAMPDDLEVAFRRVGEGLKTDWGTHTIHLGRGSHREHVDDQGRRWGHITDEIAQRGFYRQWKSLMKTRA